MTQARRCPTTGGNFLKLLIENQRLAVLPEVAVQFRRLKNEAEGVADCLIETAFPLNDAQVDDLLAVVGQRSSAASSSPTYG